jgi:glutamate synthase domain-containing protein 2
MPYSRDILNLKRDLVKAADTSNYYDPVKLIRDARKAQDGVVPYSGMGARSTNEYFTSIEIPGASLKKTEENYRYLDTSLEIGGRYSDHVITSDVPFFVSGMSYGSLKLPAKIALHLALNVLAKDGIRVMMNTGEGGALPWELYGSDETRACLSLSQRERMMDYTERLLKEHNLDHSDREELFHREYPLLTQYASGRFWKDPSYLLNADAIEIKIGQGAKIGHGGLLPSAKVTELVAENRGIPPYREAHSPSRHLDILGPEDLVAKVLELREITEWKKPIIVKVGASRVYDDTTIILKSYADAMAIDGYVGGTGAAPWEVRDVIGINTVPAVKAARDAIADYYSNHEKDSSKLLVHGGIWDSERIAKCIALGADGVGIGTGFMLTMGCTLVQDCYTNECPAGLTGSYEKLNIQETANGIVNYVKGTMLELQNIAGSLGRKSIHDLRPSDLIATDEIASIVTGLSFKNGATYRDLIKARLRPFLEEMRGIKKEAPKKEGLSEEGEDEGEKERAGVKI